jgi:long-subunit fatty acid transport protein
LCRLTLWACALVWAGSSSAARADPFHFQSIPLGQRALGFGGAFTGVADDPSAAYYNPAGLVWTGDSALSASLTLNAFDRQTIVDGYRTPVGNATLKHDSGPSLPSSIGFVKRLGKRGPGGERAHALGISTFSVEQRTLGFDVEVQNQPGGDIATLSVDRSERTAWQGVSYAYRVSDSFSFGVSGFLSLTRNLYREELVNAELGAALPEPGSFEADRAAWESHRVDANVKNLVTRFGALYQVNDQWRVGVMFEPPCLHVRGKASVRERRLESDVAGSAGSFFNSTQHGLAAHYPMPWEIRLGASYKPLQQVTLSLDGSLYGPTGTQADPVVAIGDRKPDPATGAVASVGHFELDRWYRKTSGNVSFGTEVRLWEMISVRAGVFTSLSAAPRIPSSSTQYYAPDVNRFGGALSVGLTRARYDISLGATGMFGVGRGMALDTTNEAEPYQRTEVRDATLFVFLTGARSAIPQLAKDAQERFLK